MYKSVIDMTDWFDKLQKYTLTISDALCSEDLIPGQTVSFYYALSAEEVGQILGGN